MRRLLPALAAVLLLSACGLPLPEGVRSAGDVQPVRDEPGALRVIAPGPRAGASPEEIVQGFLRAQSSPAEGHAVAREFLAPGTAWDDEQGAVIYRARRLVGDGDADALTFRVRFDTSARIEPTGAFVLENGPVDAPYTVARMPSGEYRLTSVPDGLHLRDADRASSFRPYDVYFLARGLDGQPIGRLVPDRVFLPVTAERAPALVRALLRGPTLPLAAAVGSAVPSMAKPAPEVSVADGVVTVELPDEVAALGTRERQRLSAQFTWTLVPTFTGVRLLMGGRPLDVAGAGEVQTPDDWREFDPAGVSPTAPLLFVQGRRLRSLDDQPPAAAVASVGQLPVDEVAISPVAGTLGLLTRSAGADEVRIGPMTGPFGAAALRRRSLGSLSWGSGEQGLWLLDRSGTPAICLLAAPGTPARTDPCNVSYERPADAGPLSALRVSRDGARIAMVFGEGVSRRLYVGRIVPTAGRLRIALGPDPRPIAPGLTDVTDVAWDSGTSLAVLAAASGGGTQVVVWRVPVDGSTAPAAVQRSGLPLDAVSVAAAPERPLVVGALVQDRSQLYRDNGTLFVAVEPGAAPAYPG